MSPTQQPKPSLHKRPHDSTARIIEYDSNLQRWKAPSVVMLTDITPPQICYIFLESGIGAKWYHEFIEIENDQQKKENKHDREARQQSTREKERAKVLKHFDVPHFLRSDACTKLNGYFGSKSSYNSDSSLHALSTWFRILTKRVLKPEEPPADDGKDYQWFEMGIFTYWENETICRVLCIDTPRKICDNLSNLFQSAQGSLSKSTPDSPSKSAQDGPSKPTPEMRDPFSLLSPLFDEIVKLCDDSTWRAAKRVREIEKNRKQRPDFEELRNLARHTGHLVEVHDVAIGTLESLVKCQSKKFDSELSSKLSLTYKTQAVESLDFQLSTLRSLKLRGQSTHERLQEEINLRYNMLASSDNTIMKSITLLTMIFLPSTFITSLFSTTFFAFQDNEWQFSNKFWIYWVIVVPLTLIVVLFWKWWIVGGEHVRLKWLTKKQAEAQRASFGRTLKTFRSSGGQKQAAIEETV